MLRTVIGDRDVGSIDLTAMTLACTDGIAAWADASCCFGLRSRELSGQGRGESSKLRAFGSCQRASSQAVVGFMHALVSKEPMTLVRSTLTTTCLPSSLETTYAGSAGDGHDDGDDLITSRVH